jgi:acyl carrier protein
MTMDILKRVKKVAQTHLPLDAQSANLHPEIDLKALGLDSLGLAGFLIDLEAEFGVTFPSQMITRETFRTPRTVEAAVRSLLVSLSPSSGRCTIDE